MLPKKINTKLLIFLLIAFFNSLGITTLKAASSKQAASITITSPVGGELYRIGETTRITWTSTQVSFVNIYLSTDGGVTWQTLASNKDATIGYWDWTISSAISPTQQALIRIYDYSNSSVFDESAANFTISKLSITNPIAGDRYLIGSNININWSSSSDISSVKLEYTLDGSAWNTIGTYSASLGTVSWTIPSIPSSQIQIRITDLTNSPSYSATSGVFQSASLTLNSPNGGETLYSNQLSGISWSSQNITYLTIQLSTDNGATWNNITTVSAASGSYSWTVPQYPSTQALIKIYDSQFSSISDQSDNVFTIYSLNLTSPDGGEGWTIGSSKNVTWSSNIPGNVRVELSTDGGSTFSNTLASSVAASTGGTTVTVPNTPTTSAVVRVISVSNSSLYDISSSVFHIGEVTISAPSGGEQLSAGGSYTIKWSSSGINSLGLEYSTDGGSNWNLISIVNASNGQYTWSIPQTLSASSVIIRARDYETGTDIYDVSAPFSISALILSSPNGGEGWEAGTTHNITWSASSSISNISIQYSTDDGLTWGIIDSNYTASSGSYSWKIPSTLSSKKMRIKITDKGNSGITDVSDSQFKIGDVYLTQPNGGESLFAGGTYRIKWTNSSSVDYISFQYSTDGGVTFYNTNLIIPASQGYYDWTVPNVSTTNGRIRLFDAYYSGIDDSSSSSFTIASLSVTSPNGGEGFKPGSKTSITWSSSSISNVKIEFSADGGSTWQTIASSVSASTGTYSWTIPNQITSKGLIKVVSLSDSSFNDISNNYFKIANITVNSPNGGERYQSGKTQSISWSATSNVSSVNIELSTDGGSTWSNIATNQSANQNYSWRIGTTPSSNALIRVTDASNSSISDTSDNSFVIESLSLVYPSGGEYFLADSVINITWNSSQVSNLKIELSTDNGQVWSVVTSSTPASSGSYSWTIPNAPSRNALLRISDADYPSANISDEMTSTFTINTLYLTSPNGNESFTAGSTESIKWQAHSSVTTVELQYSTDSGASWNTITNTQSASTGIYQWVVPNVVTSNALVRIINIDRTNEYDESNATFSIGTLSLTSPNGGEVWQVNTVHNITWQNIPAITTMKIELSTDNGANWQTITSSADATLGTYSWTVPNLPTSQAIIRISDVNDSTFYDQSNSDFSIASVSVQNPNGGEILKIGDVYAIKWSSSSLSSVDIAFSSDNGASWSNVATGVNAGTGIYNWTVPNAPTTTGLIKVSYTQDASIYDVSDANFSILSLNLTSPTGGEGWKIGDSKNITWTESGVNTIKIEYSTDSGNSWNTIITGVNAADLTYNWTVPNIASDKYRIKLTDETNTSLTSQSSSDFVVGNVTISSPVAGDIWRAGTTHEIKWQASQSVSTVKIDYSTDNGTSWNSITTATAASSGSYFWTIPGNISTSQAKIRVYHSLTGSEITATSSAFQISALQLTSPTGGEYIQAGSTEQITWSSSNVSTVTIEYSTDNGTTWNNIVSGYSATTQSYNWSVPSNISSKTALVKIYDSANPSIKDSSGSNFTIGWILVTSPTIDSSWQAGKNVLIKWNNSTSVDFVNIEYSTGGGVYNSIAQKITASDKQYNWNIPSSLSSNSVTIRISDWASNNNINDESAPFKIFNLVITSPNGNENWKETDTNTVTWNASSFINFINIYYSTDNGTTWNSIVANYSAGSGKYNWVLPTNILSTTALVKIENADNTNIYDVSDANFTISYLKITSNLSSKEFQAGKDNVTINWNASNINNVVLEYSLDNGSTWGNYISTSEPASSGQYIWNIPSSISSNQIRIRISSKSYSNVYDVSDVFVVKKLTVTQPNGNEEWLAGSSNNITWQSGEVNNVDIYYSTDNGTNWNKITTGVNANLGTYSWSIPAGLSSSNALIKVVDSSNPAISDSSDATFSIGTITLDNPTAATEAQSDRDLTIQWTSSNIANVNIVYSLDNGVSWSQPLISGSTAGQIGKYVWHIPSTVYSDQAKIKVYSTLNNNVNVVSPLFKIKKLDLTSPDGNEIYQAGSTVSITWSSQYVNYINLQYSTDAGQSWNNIASNVAANSGNYSWNVPSGISSPNMLIKLTDVSNSAIYDSSASTFTIGNLVLTSPTAGTDWQVGKYYNITWNAGNISNVKLDISTDNGNSWTTIVSSVAASIGTYKYLVPDGYQTLQALIRITSVSNNSIVDTSGLFTIKKLKVTSPVGGITWQAGATRTITWSSANVDSINIYYSIDGGANYQSIATNINTITTSSYDWAIPSSIASSNVFIKIVDVHNTAVNDTNDTAFTIGDITITSPTSGTEWQAGKQYTISWTANNLNNVSIKYSLDNGVSWNTIISSFSASSGSYSWTLPTGISSAQALIKLQSTSDTTVYLTSNLFTIKDVNVTSPNGGEFLFAGQQTQITWQVGQIDTVNLYYSTNGGSNWGQIATNIAATTGSYNWTPQSNIVSSNVFVKVEDASNSSIYDISDNSFSIGQISITAPTSSSVLQVGRQFNITWTSNNISTITAYYSTDDGATWAGTIFSNLDAALSSYTWTVPDIAGQNTRIKIVANSGNTSVESQKFTVEKLALTSPTNSDLLQSGTNFDIQWNETSVNNVNIYYSTSAAGPFNAIVQNYAANNLKYTWAIPSSLTTSSLYIKIVDAANSNVYDINNTAFTIAQLNVTAPVNGVYQTGKPLDITWTASNTGTLIIYVSYDGGATLEPLYTITDPSTGKVTWTPDLNRTSVNAFIKVVAQANSNVSSLSSNFELRKLDLTSPDGGEKWLVNSPHDITWSSSGVNSIDIYYSTNNGASWNSIKQSQSASSTPYSWTPASTLITSQALIKIVDSDYPSIKDSSSATFILENLLLSTPSGGEKYQEGRTLSIDWQASGNITAINIYYNVQNQWQTLQTNIATSSKPYTFTIPAGWASNNARIRITDYPNEIDTSESSAFTIAKLTLQQPLGNEFIPAGSHYSIKWQSSYVNLLNILYSTDNGSTWDTIATNYDATVNSSFNWLVPNNLSTNSAILKIVDAQSSGIYSQSNATFTIGSLLVLYPNGGEQLNSDNTYQIKWTASSSITNIMLQYSLDNGGTWNDIIKDTVSTGVYNWHISPQLSSDSALIRIGAVGSGWSLADTSDATFVIGALLLTSPSGGEQFKVGDTTLIKWSNAASIDSLKIEYSPDKTNWLTIASTYPANKPNYKWVIPNNPSNTVYLRISDIIRPTYSDITNTAFRIADINLVNNTTKKWLVGKVYPIKWSKTSNVDSVDLYYENGVSTGWNYITTVGGATTSYNWTLPNVASTGYKLKVADRSSGGVILDTSGVAFTVSELKFTAPSKGETLLAGSPYNIKWTKSADVDTMEILFTSDGVNWNIIATLDSTRNSFNWSVPANVNSASDYLIIREKNYPQIADTVGAFNVVTHTVVLTYPNGGENFNVGQDVRIKWNASSSISTVRLLYSSDNGATWDTANPIADVAASAGEYLWKVTSAYISDSAKIKIFDVNNPYLRDSSNSPFNIGSIQIVQPNGNEHWQGGTRKDIKWTASNNIANVAIDYSLNGGRSWVNITPSVAANSSPYSWLTPTTYTDSALIRIRDANSLVIGDTSKQFFRFSLLTLVKPNGNENLQSNRSYEITWTNSPDIKQVMLAYSIDSTNWQNITSSPLTASDGKYTWDLANVTCGNVNYIRISDFNAAGVFDVNDQSFNIKSLDITKPDVNSSWRVGTTQKIQWSSCSVDTLEIYFTSDGSTWSKVADVVAATSEYNWTVPNVVSDSCRIKLVYKKDNNIYSISNKFETYIPQLTVVSPNGGEVLQVDSSFVVSWLPTKVNQVKIELFNGTNWTTLKTNIPAIDSSYSFTMPDLPTNSALIRISDVSDPTVADSSNNYFRIVKLSLTYPNGGEYLAAGKTHKIRWLSSSNLGNVIVSYTLDGSTYVTLPTVAGTADSTTFTIPSNSSSTSAKVKIVAANASNVQTISGSNFTVGWVKLNSPVTNQQFQAGRTMSLSWDMSQSIRNNIRLDLVYPTGMQSFSFTNAVKSTNVTLDKNLSGNVSIILSASNSNYSIADTVTPVIVKQLQLTQPVGGENISSGSQYTIKWIASSNISNVTIEISTDNGQTWDPNLINAAIHPASDSQYVWNVPLNLSAPQSLIKIYDSSNQNVIDSSATFNIYTSSLSVLSPNGGEFYNQSDSIDVKWSASFVTAVRVYLSTDNGATWSSSYGPFLASAGSRKIAVPPNADTRTALIKVMNFADTSQYDISDAPFKIGNVHITAPVANQHFRAGLVTPVTWTSTNSVNKVNIYYVQTDTVPIALGINSTNTPSSYNWKIPANLEGSVKLLLYDYESNKVIKDSSGSFIVSKLKVTYPNGGEFLPSSNPFTITWTSSNNIPYIKANLIYYVNGQAKVIDLTSGASILNSGSLKVTMPKITTDSAKVEIYDGNYPQVSDSSDDYFRIGNLELLTLKNGGKVQYNRNVDVQWTSSSNVNSFKFSYKTSKNSSWSSEQLISATQDTKGIWHWTWHVLALPSTDCYIRLRDASGQGLGDSTNSPFTIAKLNISKPLENAYLQIAAPGRNYKVSVVKKFVGDVQLELDLKGTTTKHTFIIPSASTEFDLSAEIENWGITDAGDYRLIVTDATDPSINDTVQNITLSYLRLIQPNGNSGEKIGTQYDVKWEASAGTIQNLNIAIKTTSNPTYGLPINPSPLDPSATSDWVWNINIPPDPAVTMKIYDKDHPEIYDESDNTFILAQIQLLTAVGGERWQLGKKYPIIWKTQFINKFRIEANFNNGSGNWNILKDTTISASSNVVKISYDWLIDRTDSRFFPSDQVIIRVSSIDFPNIMDTSKSTITITRLDLMSPNSLVAWTTGTTHSIKWESEYINQLNIFLQLSPNQALLPINNPHTITQTAQEYQYTVPQGISTNQARIIIQDKLDASIADTSDVPFVVGPAPEAWVADKYQKDTINIKWQYLTPGDKIRISHIAWRFSGKNAFSNGDNGLIVSTLGPVTGPVFNQVFKWKSNLSGLVDNFEGLVDLMITYHSDYNVDYNVEIDSVKIDNKPPSFDFTSINFKQDPFKLGWDKTLAFWKTPTDTSKPITIIVTDQDDSTNAYETIGDSVYIKQLYTGKDYSFVFKVKDKLGNSTEKVVKYHTYNIADYDNSKSIDASDISAFIKSWNTPDSIYLADMYPQDTLKYPQVKVRGDSQLDIHDLLAFIDMWIYDKQNIYLPKLAKVNYSGFEASDRRMIQFKKGTEEFTFPFEFNSSVKSLSIRFYYNPSTFKFDSVGIVQKKLTDNSLKLFYTDSVNGILYFDFAQLDGKPINRITLSTKMKVSLNKFLPQDSIYVEYYGVTSDGKPLAENNIIYKMKEVPNKFFLYQNYPNPFNPTTTIEYDLPKDTRVRLSIYNILGQEVGVLVNKVQKAGAYKVRLDANKIHGGLSTGVYFYRIVTDGYVNTKKLLLLK